MTGGSAKYQVHNVRFSRGTSCIYYNMRNIRNMKQDIIFNDADYGLMAYRKEDFEDKNTNFQCQKVFRIYCAPEVLLRISSSFTAAADVYRLEKCLDLLYF